MPTKEDTEARHVAQSRHSKTAGRLLQRARQASGMSQTEFATAIARRLGIPSLTLRRVIAPRPPWRR